MFGAIDRFDRHKKKRAITRVAERVFGLSSRRGGS
jgi:hypothetical protein